MLVKLLVQVGTDEIVGNVGEVVEVNDSDARFMIRAGYCEAVDETPGQDDEIDGITA